MACSGETDLRQILKTLKPKHNPGDFVFCSVDDLSEINLTDVVMHFKEEEGVTIIIRKELADTLNMKYSFVASWITLTVHSSLSAVGLTATFSIALANNGISCNVVAAFYHDHIFVDKRDVIVALDVLARLSD